MPQVLNYRGSWDIDQKIGVVQLALAGGTVATTPSLDAANFTAVMTVLGSDPNIQYDPAQKRLFSPN
ncbi:hypothetical protein [Mesorhizobium australicum]|jgi:hypothetical protein|uniref:Uncharacterized protein n=1 Tax=Mesorhizobium australicum TaxID=536018 RepID=A0A1X7N7F4_9HYPH|nr:hypothetical protein [Mesorhizobium australicum]SMH33409.1 hypothetical protein SAMN02982922_1410 [Mesorhizobium australicum]